MPYYRIKIDELKNGKTRYVPQEGFLVEYGGWVKRQDIRWDDMYKDGFDTEEDALEMINHVRGYRNKKEGEQVKSSKYKMIE
jgi:hypothetical protein